jgi:spermidine/putrescine ABC transporter ATP-binding subunit
MAADASRGVSRAKMEDVCVPQVELAEVERVFGGVRAVQNVSLTIGKGEFFSLLGPSGCGKTTTLRIVAGFETPNRGEVRIGGQGVTSLPANKRPTNMVFQQLALFPHLSVFENVAFGPRLRRLGAAEIRGRVREALALVNLNGFEERGATQLSGGQQQRVALARALVNEPAVLLLDEPFAALDLKLRMQMQIELKALQRRLGTTFIFVTHDQTEAFAMSDRIALMNAGRVEQVGSPRDLYERPANRFVAEFMGETNLIEGRVLPGGARMQVDGTSLEIDLPGPALPEGASIAVSLRPENVALQEPVSTAPRLKGIVSSAVFRGPLARLAIDLEAGLRIQALVLNSGPVSAIAAGEAVSVNWSPTRLAVLQS